MVKYTQPGYKRPIIPTTFLFLPFIKKSNLKDINYKFDEAEDARIWRQRQTLEGNGDDRTTQENNDQTHQAKSNYVPSSFSLFFFYLFFLFFPFFSCPKTLHKYGQKNQAHL